MTDRALHIDWSTHEATDYACKHWHYSKTLPMPPLVKIGVWEFNRFIGVVLFSRGASANIMRPYGLTMQQGCELTRVALNSHVSPVSMIVKHAIKFLKKNSPALRLIVSFADPAYNHHGGIYQAGNWIYTGLTATKVEYLHNGRRLHTRQVSSTGLVVQFGKQTRVPRPEDCKVVKLPGKHRYLMPLDKAMREQIAPLAKPYPKRAASIDSDACSSQLQKGGATPTAALNS